MKKFVTASAFAFLAVLVPMSAWATDPITQTDIHSAVASVSTSGSSAVSSFLQAAYAVYGTRNPNATVNPFSAGGAEQGYTNVSRNFSNAGFVDVPMSQAVLDGISQVGSESTQISSYTQIPVDLQAIAFGYNVPGLADSSQLSSIGLNLNAEALAKIYLGQITAWNDPYLCAINPRLTTSTHQCALPNARIAVGSFSVDSGETWQFTNWLNSTAPGVWSATATTAALSLPSGGFHAGSDQAMWTKVSQTPNSIAFGSSAAASLTQQVEVARVVNAAGVAVAPNASAVLAAANAKVGLSSNNFSIANPSAVYSAAYPLATYEWAIIKTEQAYANTGHDNAQLMVKLLDWLTQSASLGGGNTFGQEIASVEGYVPLPSAISAFDRRALAAVKYQGSPLLPSAAQAALNFPGAATSVVGHQGVSSARVTWSAAPTNGTGPITSYIVTANPSGATCATAYETSCVIKGLTNGVSYRFLVLAGNLTGYGPESTPSAPVIPIGPSAAPKLVVGHDGTNLNVSWEAPAFSGSALEGYVFSVTPKGSATETQSLPVESTGYAITNLTDNQEVTISLVALTAGGYRSPASVVTTTALLSTKQILAAAAVLKAAKAAKATKAAKAAKVAAQKAAKAAAKASKAANGSRGVSSARSTVSAARAATIGRVADLSNAGLDGDLVLAGSAGAALAYSRRKRRGVDTAEEPTELELTGGKFHQSLSRATLALSARFPLYGSLLGDGNYLRSIIGAAELFLVAVGAITGALAASGTHAHYVIPSVACFTVALLLGAVDALAGFAAWFTFTAVCLVSGNITRVADVTTLVLLGGLWFGVTIMISHMRPFLRPALENGDDWWQRGGDLVVGGLLTFFLVSKLTQSFPTLTGSGNLVAHHQNILGVLFGVVIVVRYVVTSLLSAQSPVKMALWASPPAKQSTKFAWVSKISEMIIVTAIVAHALHITALTILLLVMYAIDLVAPYVMKQYTAPSAIYRLIPRAGGILLVIALAIGLLTKWSTSWSQNAHQQTTDVLVGLVSVAAVLTAASSIKGEGGFSPVVRRLGGVVIVVVTALELSGHLIH